MPFQVTLETENHRIIENVHEKGWLLDFPEATDKGYCCVKYIDRYGDTVFNRLQMIDFIAEMGVMREKTQDEDTKTVIDEIIQLAEKCKAKPHLYIKFYGD